MKEIGDEIDHLDRKTAKLDEGLAAQHKANPISQLLEGIPGVGPVGALSLAIQVDAGSFQSGRHFAAWLGLTPQERSTGGRQKMVGISRAGNERLRQLLVLGATAVIRFAKPGGRNSSPWLLNLLERKPRKLVAVALANKIARIAWAKLAKGSADEVGGRPAEGMMTSGEAFRRAKPVAAA